MPLFPEGMQGACVGARTIHDVETQVVRRMCYLYPQVYEDGCAVREGAPIVTSCPAHLSTFRETKKPCDRGKVIISTCGPCPYHGEPDNPAGSGKASAPAPGSPQHSDAPRNPDKPESIEDSAPPDSGSATSTSVGWQKTGAARLSRFSWAGVWR